ncbi:C-type lectin domain family 4 member C-like [Patiria miniata]|uniref:C-type lectin domain-containing protein n=1 Tax=Patiria miniata TaxID=46514 RepID=A0A913ZVU0_PATMI|nr:C-type lectin domain family 4 member C-like [Patiria miniata]
MGIVIFLTLAIGVQHVASIAKICPSSEWVLHKGTCYLIPQTSYSWSYGRALCKSLGGDMVLPTSQDENDFVQQMIYADYIPYNGINPNPWMRCQKTDTPRICSEDPGNYANWSPDHVDIGDCAVMIFHLGVWRGLNCSLERKIMCTAKPNSCSRSLSCAMVPYDQPRCLTNHTIDQFTMRSHIECCIACSEDLACQSFNLMGEMCQLNSATVAEVDAKYSQTLDNCAYYEYKLE